MRNQLICTLIVAACSFFAIGCDKDDDYDRQNEETAKVSVLLQVGTWKITRYKDNGTDRTALWSGYVFKFDSGNVLRATLGATTSTGSWSITADDDRTNDLDLNLFFANATDLRSINEEWDIINYNENRIEVADDYGDVDEDLLVFEKQ
ncbi:hypothetical protein PQ465_07460 [Sphingobacterium oryzagri]|uniref:Lipocalin-like domain-containing protein n=1 Tax=Sphingobacterium oryzagri TaxID=3025669 RepID=A0ABY7WKS7_9SPHI|nr:hypothetical protein [Sphingobacterium sp. KACC 22765]WDF70206.1 hypothetical protein PQ465_07460 [Sphingobacterium sp. KACC 22765]